MAESSDILVSVIIAVYNKKRTLLRCLRSIISQSYPNIEILIIDDCSTDGSARVARRLMSQDKRIRLLELTHNYGLYNTHIIGIQEIKGAYCVFADADDTMEPKAIETMLSAMKEHNVDLVQTRYHRRMKGLEIKYFEHWDPELAGRRIDGSDFRSLASYVGMDSYIYPSCWGKMYRTDLLRSYEMIDFKQFWGEDQIFNIQYLRQARSIAFVDYVGYCYYWGGDTTVNYKFSMLRQYKHVYSLKKIMGQSEEYINAEIIMLLRYYVRMLLTELSWTNTAVEKVMADELKDPLWRQVGLELTAAELVEEENEKVQKAPLKYLAKKFLK